MINRLERKDYKRNEHIKYFTDMADCNFNISMDVDITSIIEAKKRNDYKFYPMFLYRIARALNRIFEARIFKIDENYLYYYDYLSPSYTIFNDKNKTFSINWTEYDEDFNIFYKRYLFDNDKVDGNKLFQRQVACENLVSISALPWMEYRSFEISLKHDDYLLPIVTFGSYYRQEGSYRIPVSIRANHKTLDGYHIHLFFSDLSKVWGKD